MKSWNIAAALTDMAISQAETLALAIPLKNSIDKNGTTRYRQYSFKELAFETACVARGLLHAGFERGERVVVMTPPGFDFFTLAFAMLQTGIVPVFVDPGVGIGKVKTCIDEAEPSGFIGITKAHVARVLLAWGKKSIRKTVSIGPRLGWSGEKMDAIRNFDRTDAAAPFFEAGPDDLAAIIFTSGSTGIPKGAVYTHGNFSAQLNMIRDTFGFVPGEIDMPTFPPFALFNPALGMSSILPDMDPTRPAFVYPKHIIGPIQQFGITNMFGSPALLNKVARYGEAHHIKLPSLKRAISAGAPVPARTLSRFSSMLGPDVRILTPYGATEAMPVSIANSQELLSREIQEKTANGAGICLGKAVSGMQIAIIRISDAEIPVWDDNLLQVPQGVVGEIVVSGLNVTQSYFNRDSANRLSKIRDGHQMRHRMGDLGYVDAEGNLWFCGRKAHRVQAGGQELYSVPCEQIFNQHPGVFRTALVGVNGQAVLCVEREKDIPAIHPDRLRGELLEIAAAHPRTRLVQTILFHPGFPVDFRHNAKINREKLGVWAKNKLS